MRVIKKSFLRPKIFGKLQPLQPLRFAKKQTTYFNKLKTYLSLMDYKKSTH